MDYELVTIKTHRFAVMTQHASAERDQLEVTLPGGPTVLWGERYRDRLWLWTASGRQVATHTLGAAPMLPSGLNPVVAAAARAAIDTAAEPQAVAARAA